MQYYITVGNYQVGMLDKVEIHKSVELLADTARIVLPGAQYNAALDVENQLKRGDKVTISLGYTEVGMVTEFVGYLQRVGTDDGSITLECEDDLFLFRKDMKNGEYKKITILDLLKKVVAECKLKLSVSCSYTWVYNKFVVNNATGYDVLKKLQEDSGADIYIKDGTLHVHPPGEVVGELRIYDFAENIEKSDLKYQDKTDKRVLIVVKANMPDGTVKEVEVGTTGGDKVEVKSASSDIASMKERGAAELKRRNFSGYDGSITTWLVPECLPGDSAKIIDKDYPKKEGTYFVQSVTTEFGSNGGSRKVELGFRLS